MVSTLPACPRQQWRAFSLFLSEFHSHSSTVWSREAVSSSEVSPSETTPTRNHQNFKLKICNRINFTPNCMCILINNPTAHTTIHICITSFYPGHILHHVCVSGNSHHRLPFERPDPCCLIVRPCQDPNTHTREKKLNTLIKRAFTERLFLPLEVKTEVDFSLSPFRVCFHRADPVVVHDTLLWLRRAELLDVLDLHDFFLPHKRRAYYRLAFIQNASRCSFVSCFSSN